MLLPGPDGRPKYFSKKCPRNAGWLLLPVSRPTRGRDTPNRRIMKNNTKPTLALRAQSIRNLTAAELRVANGGQTCTHSHATRSDGTKCTIKTK